MDLRDYVRVLRRRWRLITLAVLFAICAAASVTYASAKQYTSTTQFFVSTREGAAGATDIGSAYTGGLFTQQRVKSYTSVVTSERVADLVKTDLGLLATPASIRSEITASAPLDTVLLNVSVNDRNPQRAQQIAASIGRVFPQVVDALEAPSATGESPVKVSVAQAPQLGVQTAPRSKLNLMLGLLVGLVVGIAAAVAREAFDTSVKGIEQASELTGASVVGTISFDAEASGNPLVVVSAPGSPRSESFRQLRTNLQFVQIGHSLKSVVLTSSVAGEGKSTTCCNLAITLCEAGLRVVLVEADLRRPRVAEYMGVEGSVGLTSVLLGRVAIDDALQQWGDTRLAVLASGPLPPNPSELLGSEQMQSLLSALEQRADIILIDAPPLLPVTDAAVLSAHTSGVVLVIRSNKTRREQVARSADILRSVDATVLGTVLNMVPLRGPDAYAYGYGQGYGYSAKATGSLGRLSREDATLLSPLLEGPSEPGDKPRSMQDAADGPGAVHGPQTDGSAPSIPHATASGAQGEGESAGPAIQATTAADEWWQGASARPGGSSGP